MNIYTVYDKGKLVAKDVLAGEVSRLTGVNTSCLHRYKSGMTLYQGRYQIIGVDDGKAKGKTGNKFSDATIKDWDENMMVAADLIRTGKGRIVTRRVKDKLIKYVERVS